VAASASARARRPPSQPARSRPRARDSPPVGAHGGDRARSPRTASAARRRWV